MEPISAIALSMAFGGRAAAGKAAVNEFEAKDAYAALKGLTRAAIRRIGRAA